MLDFPDQDFPKIRFKINKNVVSKIVVYHFVDSGKIIGTFDELKPKITYKSRNLQENVLK